MNCPYPLSSRGSDLCDRGDLLAGIVVAARCVYSKDRYHRCRGAGLWIMTMSGLSPCARNVFEDHIVNGGNLMRLKRAQGRLVNQRLDQQPCASTD